MLTCITVKVTVKQQAVRIAAQIAKKLQLQALLTDTGCALHCLVCIAMPDIVIPDLGGMVSFWSGVQVVVAICTLTVSVQQLQSFLFYPSLLTQRSLATLIGSDIRLQCAKPLDASGSPRAASCMDVW